MAFRGRGNMPTFKEGVSYPMEVVSIKKDCVIGEKTYTELTVSFNGVVLPEKARLFDSSLEDYKTFYGFDEAEDLVGNKLDFYYAYSNGYDIPNLNVSKRSVVEHRENPSQTKELEF